MKNAEVEPECVMRTLEWCNLKRQEQGKGPLDKLPRGKRGNSLSCPCGKATGLVVGGTNCRPATEEEVKRGIGWVFDGPFKFDTAPIPPGVSEFVDMFDKGKLPQYDEVEIYD